ncbi:hypothetical protein ACU4HD_01745 [Cupriavidus basilensis]
MQKSGYGKRKLPKGQAWGVAVHESFNTVVAYVVEVSLVKNEPRGASRDGRGACQPRGQSHVRRGAGAGRVRVRTSAMTRPGFAIEIENGSVKNSNFPDYPPPRITDAPVVDVFFVPSGDPPTGLGEPGVPAIAPAVANALLTLTGKRQRQLPFCAGLSGRGLRARGCRRPRARPA